MTATMTEPVQGEAEQGDRSMGKKKLLTAVSTHVQGRIGREPRVFEKSALGFLIEQHRFHERMQQDQTAETFLSSVCGVNGNDSQREVSIKILKAVCEAVDTEYQTRFSSAKDRSDAKETSDLEALNRVFVKKLEERLTRVTQTDNAEEVHFSGVPGPWIPAWVPLGIELEEV